MNKIQNHSYRDVDFKLVSSFIQIQVHLVLGQTQDNEQANPRPHRADTKSCINARNEVDRIT